jgi:hypothetical protein
MTVPVERLVNPYGLNPGTQKITIYTDAIRSIEKVRLPHYSSACVNVKFAGGRSEVFDRLEFTCAVVETAVLERRI